MPEILIRDITGTDRNYTTNDVAFRSPNGGTVNYTYGNKSTLNVNLDFAGGDMAISAPAGTLYNRVTIPKPATLISENIAEGIVIAGIEGTFEGGGGGETSDWATYNTRLQSITAGATITGTDDDVVMTYCFRILKEVIAT